MIIKFNKQQINTLPAALSKHFRIDGQPREQLQLTDYCIKSLPKVTNMQKKSSNKTQNLLGNITEIITSGEEVSSVAMLLPLLATLSKDDRWFAWVSPPKHLPKELLKQAGIEIDKVMLLYPDEQNSALSLAKKALSAGTCHAVISWNGILSEHEFANLEQSAKAGASHGILIRQRAT